MEVGALIADPTLYEDVKMQFPHSRNDRFGSFLIVCHSERRILVRKAAQSRAKLLSFGITLTLYADRDDWSWKLNRFKNNRLLLAT